MITYTRCSTRSESCHITSQANRCKSCCNSLGMSFFFLQTPTIPTHSWRVFFLLRFFCFAFFILVWDLGLGQHTGELSVGCSSCRVRRVDVDVDAGRLQPQRTTHDEPRRKRRLLSMLSNVVSTCCLCCWFFSSTFSFSCRLNLIFLI